MQDATTSISASMRPHAAIEQRQQQLQQQERRRLAAAASVDEYSGQDLAGGSAGGSGDGSVWGRFSAGVGFADRTQFRTLMPDQTKLSFSHSGASGLQSVSQLAAGPCMHAAACMVN
jgi:hypothetical protein